MSWQRWLDPVSVTTRTATRLLGQQFVVPASAITIRHAPNELYQTVLDCTKEAKHRISLASLYLGHGELERALVTELALNVRARVGAGCQAVVV
jgi:phosphatidylserine/phosphatidylglycerophosphate/cardiolipin synthase-like enzyme